MQLLETLLLWGERVYSVFSQFIYFASQPLVPENTFTSILEKLNVFNPLYNLMMSIFGVDSVFELTIFHLFTYGIFVVCGFIFVKWILDIVL